MRKLILHIGSAKTGSSALQSYFVRHRDALAEQGLHYSQSGSDALALAGRAAHGNGAELAYKLLDDGLPDAAVEAALDTYFHKFDCGVHLLSSERFELIRPHRLALFARIVAKYFDTVEVVYLVRHVADHALSHYGEDVWLRGEAASFMDYIARYNCPFEHTLEGYAGAFGAEALRVVVYDDIKSDLARGLLAAFGLDVKALPGAERVNRSLTRHELDVARALLATSVDGEFVRRLLREHAYRTRMRDDGTSLLMTEEELLTLEERVTPMLRRLNSVYLTDTAKLNSCSDDLQIVGRREDMGEVSETQAEMVDMLRAAVLTHEAMTLDTLPC